MSISFNIGSASLTDYDYVFCRFITLGRHIFDLTNNAFTVLELSKNDLGIYGEKRFMAEFVAPYMLAIQMRGWYGRHEKLRSIGPSYA